MNDMKTADPELEVIFTPEAIAGRLGELAREIASEKAREPDGGCHLERAASYSRPTSSAPCTAWGLAPEVDFMTLSSYTKARISSGQVSILRDMDLDVRGRNVLIIDDVLDSGRTLAFAKDLIAARGAKRRSAPVCCSTSNCRAPSISSPTTAPSNVPNGSSSATVWTWRTATASCRSSGASCASRFNEGGEQWRGYCSPMTMRRRAISSSARSRRDGHSVQVTQDGSEALECVEGAGAQTFDVLVSDVEMPLLDGVEARRARLGPQPNLRVLLMSGFAEQLDRAKDA